MSKTTMTLPDDLLDELMRLLDARSKTEAVLKAIKEEIRRIKVRRIQSMTGSLEFDLTAEELRHGDRTPGEG